MVLIADSGSTKTHWVSVDAQVERHCTTEGLNPLFADDETFAVACNRAKADVLPEGSAVVEAVFFYGAGCAQELSRQRVRHLLEKGFGCGRVAVESDLLGACRAACGTTEGLVGILGTGSNLCHYDGQAIVRKRMSTGFILGDEGSGNHIGRRLLKDYLEDRMPQELSAMFHDAYKKEKADFIDCLYRRPNPNRFLASLVPFAAQHRHDSYIQDVLARCFVAFFEQLDYFGNSMSLPLHLVGGVALEFEEELRAIAKQRGVVVGVMVESPVAGLVRYHKG